MNSENNKLSINTETETINLKDELLKYLVHWRWFLLGVIVSFLLAFIYLRYATPVYLASTKIMIKDNKKSGISKELEAFKDLGIVGSGSVNNPDNEIEILKSRNVLLKVVHQLGLNVSYFVKGKIKKTEVFDKTPIKIEFIDNLLIDKHDFLLTELIFELDYSKNSFEFLYLDKKISGEYNKPIKLDKLPEFRVVKNKANFNTKNKNIIFCYINTSNKTVDKLKKIVLVAPINKKSSILKLSLQSSILNKAEIVLDKIVEIYNQEAIKDKNKLSQKTSDFITERLKNVSSELGVIDDNVKNFKKSNKITDIKSESKLFLQTNAINRQKLVEANTQLNLINSIKKELNKKTENFLPANLGLENNNISQGISRYNELISKRNRLRESAGSKNLILIDIENNLLNQKNSLTSSLENQKEALEIRINSLNKEAGRFNSKISSIPSKERKFLDIARQQQIIAGLYSYLLKKKEETEISLAINKIPNARIIEKGYGSKFPVKPRKKIIILVALFLGILIPFVIIYLINILDTKIHTKKDIEKLTSIPYLGDIPHLDNNDKIVVSYDARSSAAEAFRLIRTNLDFLLSNINKTRRGKTIFITSTISGEGKSFASINLAATLSLSGKKTILVGMDLRAPKITQYLEMPDRKGITNFLTDKNLTLDDIKFKIPEIKDLTLISSGVVPPNPAELLMNDKVDSIFEELENEYDYVLIDTAPVSLVTDTLLIAKHSDLVIYVARAGYLDKKMLEIPENLYKQKQLSNIALVLNDTDINKGYGYGYGYGYLSENKTPWYKKIFKR